jgi:hypothetical protein
MNLELFIETVTTESPFKHSDGTDIWHFHGHQKVVLNNSSYLKIATSKDGSTLLVADNSDDFKNRNLYMDNEGYLSYYCFSLTEIFHRKKLIKMYDKLRKSKSSEYLKFLEDFKFDLGCLYWVASGSMTSIFDEKLYDEKRNKISIKALKEIAEQNDPRACSEVASYYSIEEQNSELEFYFLRKAAIKGDYLSKKKLVEFITEEKNSEIELALTILTELKDLRATTAWAYYTEANIFLKGIGFAKDIKKGLLLLDTAVNHKYAMAMADYAYFLFNGIGIEQNKDFAKNLLLEANKIANGRFTDILNKMN